MNLSHRRYRKPNKTSWLNPHKCLICEADLDVVTHAHAEKHGYPDRLAFLRSGMAEPLKEKLIKQPCTH